ncbi:hypothetical protein [Methylocystis sp. ATCC 49242]|uniref:hypothetical protein n=1 Tax=Methylocystis sp. ATCC 49242 TaxID=622637 RepID=UPI0011851C44|nr:hypothetical protein [Methylocystis sp. ATCC 49242]
MCGDFFQARDIGVAELGHEGAEVGRISPPGACAKVQPVNPMRLPVPAELLPLPLRPACFSCVGHMSHQMNVIWKIIHILGMCNMFADCSRIALAGSAHSENRRFSRKYLFSKLQSFGNAFKRSFSLARDFVKLRVVINCNRAESPGNAGVAAIYNVIRREISRRMPRPSTRKIRGAKFDRR